ncbi:MAG: hypothetical protein GYA63_09295 [Armatimonadetes bacterium]|nr:hypothetical protein [Armatimonadota bacterium]
MKRVWGGVLGALVLLAVAVVTLLWSRGPAGVNVTSEPGIRAESGSDSAPDKPTATTNRSVFPNSFAKRASELTDDEKRQLAAKFASQFRPAIEKWSHAYEGRIPFRLEDVTFDQFHSRLGDHQYTFMIGDTTLTLTDSSGEARVFYLMTRQGAIALNSQPKLGTVPDLSVPVSRQDVIQMVKADTGVEFNPSEVSIKPTGAACGLMGGAFVEVGKNTGNGTYRSFSGLNISLVFGPDGKLVNYLK